MDGLSYYCTTKGHMERMSHQMAANDQGAKIEEWTETMEVKGRWTKKGRARRRKHMRQVQSTLRRNLYPTMIQLGPSWE